MRSLMLSGNAYLEAVLSEAGLAEFHVLRSDRMSLVPGSDGWPAGLRLCRGGEAASLCR